jgi:hypothetical protein
MEKVFSLEIKVGQIASLLLDLFSNEKSFLIVLFFQAHPHKGFFVECGALDGELRSNTLTLERDHGWRGVLIEADPDNLINAM